MTLFPSPFPSPYASPYPYPNAYGNGERLQLSFLSDYGATAVGGDYASSSAPHLDLHFCYRACHAAGKREACVTILSMLGQYRCLHLRVLT